MLVEGSEIGLREMHVAAIRTTDDGPIDVYTQMATLLAGPDTSILEKPPAIPPEDVVGADFMLTRLDPLIEADPFRGVRWPLARPELVAVYPFEHHLGAFIDTFRRRYLSQRGRM